MRNTLMVSDLLGALVIAAQRKIPVVFNIGQKNASIYGRHLVKAASGQKIRLIYGHYRHKAGGASPLA